MTELPAPSVVGSAAAGSGGVLIVGLAHSGKTEVRRLIETSTRAVSARRARHWNRVGNRWDDLSERSCLALMRSDETFKSWDADVDAAIRAWRTLERPRIAALFALAYRWRASASNADIWCAQVNGLEPQILRLLAELPEVKVIHTVRDPRGGLGVSRRSGMVGRRGWDLAAWDRSARVAIEAMERHRDRYQIIRWEDLVTAADEVSVQIGRFVGADLEVPEDWLLHGKPIGRGIDGRRTSQQIAGLVTGLGYEAEVSTATGSASLSDVVDLLSFRFRARRLARQGVNE